MWTKFAESGNLGILESSFQLLDSSFQNEDFPRIMLVDMNSFFASVEQQANPKYRGKPLGVCASLHPTSCIIAASKEAKILGIKTGTLIYKAKKIYPGLILVEAEPEKYREVNRGIVKIFQDYTDRFEVYSIDEAFLDLEGNGNPLHIGAEIKQRIKAEVGEWLTCSIGIAPNKFMAKLAADLQKPDGLTVVWRKNLPQIYKHKSFRDLWGVARGWERRLSALGIPGPFEMLSFPVANLMAVYGKPGFYIWQRILGLEIDVISNLSSPLTGEDVTLVTDEGENQPLTRHFAPPESGNRPKSFGHSWVLNFRTTEKARLAPVILRLGEKAARRMRAQGFKSLGAYLSIADTAGNRFHVSKKLKNPIKTGQELYEQSLQLWRNWEFKFEIMHIAVGFTNLICDSLQLDLFGDRTTKLAETLDSINDRYGEFTIRSGLLTKTQDFAPDAIAFGR